MHHHIQERAMVNQYPRGIYPWLSVHINPNRCQLRTYSGLALQGRAHPLLVQLHERYPTITPDAYYLASPQWKLPYGTWPFTLSSALRHCEWIKKVNRIRAKNAMKSFKIKKDKNYQAVLFKVLTRPPPSTRVKEHGRGAQHYQG